MSGTDTQTGSCARAGSSGGVIMRIKSAVTVTEIRLGHCREEAGWSARLPEEGPSA